MWEIDLYEKANGRCPVQEFLDGLNKKTDLPFIDRTRKLLSEKGYALGRPYVAYLRDDIYELRVRTRNGQFRILYFFYDRGTIVFTNGLHKKGEKTPDPAIDQAIEYRVDYLRRKEEQKK
ncbi:MAG: type II toxin-antitoxin system RelE/ParE family toxin [Anaerolineales bacterium]|nr:type II toxin-antitoxin system RelE/ParE family toxin [Anaerolineales bacterium]